MEHFTHSIKLLYTSIIKIIVSVLVTVFLILRIYLFKVPISELNSYFIIDRFTLQISFLLLLEIFELYEVPILSEIQRKTFRNSEKLSIGDYF